MAPKPINELKGFSLPLILASDLDDTLTTDGLLPGKVLSALEALKAKGVFVVLVTGRPAGWCDFFARMFPVDAVVGENGALVYSYDHQNRTMTRKVYLTQADIKKKKANFDLMFEQVKKAYPQVALSEDQPFRLADLAIDFKEDVNEPLGYDEAIKIKEICESFGAHAKVSSIHVNTWFGNFDKHSTLKDFVQHYLCLNFDHLVYVGDSPNDQPLFDATKFSVGVSNVKDFSEVKVNYMTKERSAEGFIELASHLLRLI